MPKTQQSNNSNLQIKSKALVANNKVGKVVILNTYRSFEVKKKP